MADKKNETSVWTVEGEATLPTINAATTSEHGQATAAVYGDAFPQDLVPVSLNMMHVVSSETEGTEEDEEEDKEEDEEEDEEERKRKETSDRIDSVTVFANNMNMCVVGEYKEGRTITYVLKPTIRWRFMEHLDEMNERPDCCKRTLCLIYCCATFIWIVRISLFALLVASIIIGKKYLHECPRERYIPIFLIGSGGFGLMRGIIVCIYTFFINCLYDWNDKYDVFWKEYNARRKILFQGITSCVMLAWNIAGAVWVYSIYHDYQSDDPAGEDYCNGTCYMYACGSLSYMLTIQLIFCGYVVIGCCRTPSGTFEKLTLKFET